MLALKGKLKALYFLGADAELDDVYDFAAESDTSPDVGTAKEAVEITQDYFDNGFTIT